MGEGAYVRIQNKSKIPVEMKVREGKKVDEAGMDRIQGVVQPNHQLPPDGTGETPFGAGKRYQYIEGDVKFFFQGDGSFQLEAHPTTGGGPPSGLKLLVDHDNWWMEDTSPDKGSPVKLVADVDDSLANKTRIEVRVYDNYDSSNWMGEFATYIVDKPLCEVSLPGTHDSGTYKYNAQMGASPDSDLTLGIQKALGGKGGGLLGNVSDFVLQQVFERLCQCQDRSVAQQLEDGVRYLDIRVACHAESQTYWTCHGVYCVDMLEIAQQIDDFLSKHPKVGSAIAVP